MRVGNVFRTREAQSVSRQTKKLQTSMARKKYARKRATSRAVAPYKNGALARSPYGMPRRVIYPRRVYRPTKRLTYSVPKSGAGSTTSKSVFGSPRVPKALYSLYKNNQNYQRQILRSQRMASTFGKQSVVEVLYGHATDLGPMFVTIPQTPSLATDQSGKFYLKNYTSKMTFTNQDLATCYLAMYELEPRFHVAIPRLFPISQWDIGFEKQTTSGVANDDYRDAYASPFESQGFCLYYKVNKVTKIELGQGQSHCHMATHNINKAVHGQILAEHSLMRGLSKINMIVISGTPINDIANKNLVSTSSCAVDMVEYLTYEYTFAPAQKTIRYYANTLGIVSNAEVNSIGAGIVVAEDEA